MHLFTKKNQDQLLPLKKLGFTGTNVFSYFVEIGDVVPEVVSDQKVSLQRDDLEVGVGLPRGDVVQEDALDLPNEDQGHQESLVDQDPDQNHLDATEKIVNVTVEVDLENVPEVEETEGASQGRRSRGIMMMRKS